ncbi:MAG: hypothetical protein JWM06_2647 [Actinomycetia bacterium]|nr:hypothetical protein [Actinomycetes bacterium]
MPASRTTPRWVEKRIGAVDCSANGCFTPPEIQTCIVSSGIDQAS